MNTFTSTYIEYLRASRTIETVLVSNKCSSQVFFIYDYEGNSFRIFKNKLDLINFFEDNAECDFTFGTEDEVDGFLATVKIAG